MDIQPDLFVSASVSVRERLLSNAKDGVLFYSISQVANFVGKTPYSVRFAITTTYHLDALKLGEEYRVPFFAILDYMDYLEAQKGPEGEEKEKDFDPARTALWYFLSRRLVWKNPEKEGLEEGKIVEKKPTGSRPYDSMPGKEEEAPLDWYSLSCLPLPFSASTAEWAQILGVQETLIKEVFHTSWKDLIQWPEMYDWLISCEVINFPIPFNSSEPVALLSEQPSLF